MRLILGIVTHGSEYITHRERPPRPSILLSYCPCWSRSSCTPRGADLQRVRLDTRLAVSSAATNSVNDHMFETRLLRHAATRTAGDAAGLFEHVSSLASAACAVPTITSASRTRKATSYIPARPRDGPPRPRIGEAEETVKTKKSDGRGTAVAPSFGPTLSATCATNRRARPPWPASGTSARLPRHASRALARPPSGLCARGTPCTRVDRARPSTSY